MRTGRQRMSRALAALGCATVEATFVAYSLMLQQQAAALGEPPVGLFGALRGAPTRLLAVLAATAASDATTVVMRFGRVRRTLLLTTAGLLTVLGVVGIFSIGFPLLVAAAVTLGAAVSDGTTPGARADLTNPIRGRGT